MQMNPAESPRENSHEVASLELLCDFYREVTDFFARHGLAEIDIEIGGRTRLFQKTNGGLAIFNNSSFGFREWQGGFSRGFTSTTSHGWTIMPDGQILEAVHGSNLVPASIMQLPRSEVRKEIRRMPFCQNYLSIPLVIL